MRKPFAHVQAPFPDETPIARRMRKRPRRWRRGVGTAAMALVLTMGGVGVGLVAADVYSAPEGVPRLLTYEGYLEDASGVPVNGGSPIVIKARIYDAMTGSSGLLWPTNNEVFQQSVTPVQGRFALQLGGTTLGLALPSSVVSGGDAYLELEVDGFLMNRQRLTSVPYALRAASAASAARAASATEAENLTANGPADSRMSAVESRPTAGSFCFDSNGSPYAVMGFSSVSVSRVSMGQWRASATPPFDNPGTSCICSSQNSGPWQAFNNSYITGTSLDIFARDLNNNPLDSNVCCICIH